MSTTSPRPLRMAGATVNSGTVNTGEVQMTTGGGIAATFYSGMAAPALTGAYGAVAVGSDVLIFSGAGRLKDILTIGTILSLSGVQTTFYDAGAPVSGGPIPASGHRIIGVLPAAFGVSGQVLGPGPFGYDIPFNSGLCFNSRSGQLGFTVTYTPETNFPQVGN